MNAQNNNILPCPFCGGPAVLHQVEASPPEIPAPWWAIDCPQANDCSVWPTAFGDTTEEAIAAWNRRAPEGEILQALKAVKALALPGATHIHKVCDDAIAKAHCHSLASRSLTVGKS